MQGLKGEKMGPTRIEPPAVARNKRKGTVKMRKKKQNNALYP